MMNKYIKEVDVLSASDKLKGNIKALEGQVNKKHIPLWKTLTTVVACFVVVCVLFASMGSSMSYDKATENFDASLKNEIADSSVSESFKDEIVSNVTASTNVNSNRKIIKEAELYVHTKEYSVFLTAFNQSVSRLQGYVEQNVEDNPNGGMRYATIKVRVPGEKLDSFIKEIESMGTVISKSVKSTDITNSYVDTESRLNALKTEQQTLLGLLENAQSLSDTLEIQSRLSQIRSEIEALQTMLNTYDEQVAYSLVTVSLNEVERESENTNTFFGKVKNTFLNSIHSLGEFFEGLGITVLGGSPYIIIGVVVLVVIILIIKKVKK